MPPDNGEWKIHLRSLIQRSSRHKNNDQSQQASRVRKFYWIKIQKILADQLCRFFFMSQQTIEAEGQTRRRQRGNIAKVRQKSLQASLYYKYPALWSRQLLRSQNAWASQYHDFHRTLVTRGGEAFAESLDISRSNFMVGLLSQYAPERKKILIDLRDEKIFRDLYKKCEGKSIVAVVNQWHVQESRLTGGRPQDKLKARCFRPSLTWTLTSTKRGT